MDEKKLVKRLKNKDKDTFRLFVEEYQPFIMNICIGFLHNKEDAEDITQDVFIEFYQSVSGFREESKISTWLYRIAVNKSLNFIRANKKYKKHENIEDAVLEEATQSSTKNKKDTDHPEFAIENKEKARILHNAVNSLPKNQKTAFILNKD